MGAETSGLDLNRLIDLNRAGLGAPAMIALIENSRCETEMTIERLAELKRASLPNPVIAALIKRCPGSTAQSADDDLVRASLLPQRVGVYFRNEWSGFRELSPVYSTSGDGGGNGSILFPKRDRLSIDGRTSPNRAQSASPDFFVRVDREEAEADGFGRDTSDRLLLSGLRLVKFDIKRDRRTLVVSSASPLGGSSGIAQTSRTELSVSRLARRVFLVSPSRKLAPGEYAILAEIGGGRFRVYDFTVP